MLQQINSFTTLYSYLILSLTLMLDCRVDTLAASFVGES